MVTDQKNAIDIKEIIESLSRRKRFLFLLNAIVIFFTLIFLFLIPNEYTSNFSFVPETESELPVGQFDNIAALAGINLNSAQGNSLSPDLYPLLIGSFDFQMKLLNAKIRVNGLRDSISYRDYYLNHYRPGLIDNITTYTIGLPTFILKTIRSRGSSDLSDSDLSESNGLFKYSVDDYELIKQLRRQINFNHSKKEGYVSISFTMRDPQLSAQMAMVMEQLLREAITEVKTAKSNKELKFLSIIYQERKSKFDVARQEYATYQDQNLSFTTRSAAAKLELLRMNYELELDLFSSINKQLEQARIQLNKDTPTLQILQPVVVPNRKSSPQRVILLMAMSFFSLFVTVSFFLFKDVFLPIIRS